MEAESMSLFNKDSADGRCDSFGNVLVYLQCARAACECQVLCNGVQITVDDKLIALLNSAGSRRTVGNSKLCGVCCARNLIGGRCTRGAVLIFGAVLRHECIAGINPADLSLFKCLGIALVTLLSEVIKSVVLVENRGRKHKAAILSGSLGNVKSLTHACDISEYGSARNGSSIRCLGNANSNKVCVNRLRK